MRKALRTPAYSSPPQDSPRNPGSSQTLVFYSTLYQHLYAQSHAYMRIDPCWRWQPFIPHAKRSQAHAGRGGPAPCPRRDELSWADGLPGGCIPVLGQIHGPSFVPGTLALTPWDFTPVSTPTATAAATARTTATATAKATATASAPAPAPTTATATAAATAMAAATATAAVTASATAQHSLICATSAQPVPPVACQGGPQVHQ